VAISCASKKILRRVYNLAQPFKSTCEPDMKSLYNVIELIIKSIKKIVKVEKTKVPELHPTHGSKGFNSWFQGIYRT
jgi:hypothetical protein